MLRLTVFVVVVAIFLYFYLDGNVPEPIPEKWKVKVMDATMKTYSYLITLLVQMGLTDQYSALDRKIADWFVLTMVTGRPWGLGYDSRLLITDTHMRGVRVKMYQPVASLSKDDRPVFIFFHGGGWSLLSVDSYDPLIRKITRDSGVVIISVDYRLSPQHPFPDPLNDCTDVVEYVMENYLDLGIDPNRIAIGGDSAGGNMAAAISLHHKNKISMQLLLVPSLQMVNFNTTGFVENTRYLNKSIHNPLSVDFVLNYLGVEKVHIQDFLENNHTSAEFKQSIYYDYIDQAVWMPKRFVRDEILKEGMEQRTDVGNEELFTRIKDKLLDPLVSPMLADDELLENLPFTYIMVCGYDFVRDDGIMFYERLKQVGEEVQLAYYYEAFHNTLFFPHGPLKMEVAVRIVADIVKALKTHL